MRATKRGAGSRCTGWNWLRFAAVFFALACGARAQLTHAGGAVDFGAVNVGGTAATQVIVFTTAAGSTVTTTTSTATTDGAANADYTITADTCSGQVAVGPATCSVTVSFLPLQRGLRRGALTVNEAGGGSTVVFLRGVGLGSQLVFSPDTATATSTVTPLMPVFYSPGSSVYDGAGNLFFNDFLNSRILEQSAAGTLSVVGALPGSIMQAMTTNGAGQIFVTVPSQSKVYSVVPGGTLSALTLTGATLGQPSGIASDASGLVYIADAQRNVIVRCNSDGSGATVLPLTGLTTALSSPEGLAVDPTGRLLYIVDSGHARVVKVTLASLAAAPVTTTGGLPFNPYGVAVDASGTIYIADTGNRRIFRILPSGAGAAVLTPAYALSVPTGITVAANGDLIVADNNNGLVRIQRSVPGIPLVFTTPTPVGTPDTADGTKFVTLQNSGNLPLQLTAVAAPATNPSTSNASFLVATNGTCPVVTSTTTTTAAQIAVGTVCTYGVTFTPNTAGTITGNLVIQSQAAGSATPVTANVPLSGTGQMNADALVLSGPTTATANVPINLTVTANMAGAVSTGYRATVTFSATPAGASFPSGATYAFTAADAGVHVFTPGVVFSTAGTYVVRVTDGTLSSSLTVNVAPAALTPAVTLGSSVNPVLVGGSTTLTATVTGPVAGATGPAGTVLFFDGATQIGSAMLANGVATAQVSFSNAGTHSLTAQYTGGTGFNAATSLPLTQTVGDFTFALAATSPASITITPGNTAVFTYTLTPVGTATFVAPVTFAATGFPDGSTVTFTPPTVAAGSGITIVTMSVAVPQGVVQMRPVKPFGESAPIAFALALLPLALWKRRRKSLRALLLMGLLVAMATGFSGCLNDQASGYFGTVPKAYTIVATASSGADSHAAAPVTLTNE